MKKFFIKRFPFFIESLTIVTNAACTLVNNGIKGMEVVLMDFWLLDIYNLERDEWRQAPPITLVSIKEAR